MKKRRPHSRLDAPTGAPRAIVAMPCDEPDTITGKPNAKPKAWVSRHGGPVPTDGLDAIAIQQAEEKRDHDHVMGRYDLIDMHTLMAMFASMSARGLNHRLPEDRWLLSRRAAIARRIDVLQQKIRKAKLS